MMFKIPCCIAITLLLVQSTQPVVAQSVPIGKDAAFAVRIDLDEVRETELGEKVLEAVRSLAASELGKGKDPDEAFEDVEKALGFDPFEELHNLTVIGQSIEDPLEGCRSLSGWAIRPAIWKV